MRSWKKWTDGDRIHSSPSVVLPWKVIVTQVIIFSPNQKCQVSRLADFLLQGFTWKILYQGNEHLITEKRKNDINIQHNSTGKDDTHQMNNWLTLTIFYRIKIRCKVRYKLQVLYTKERLCWGVGPGQFLANVIDVILDLKRQWVTLLASNWPVLQGSWMLTALDGLVCVFWSAATRDHCLYKEFAVFSS